MRQKNLKDRVGALEATVSELKINVCSPTVDGVLEERIIQDVEQRKCSESNVPPSTSLSRPAMMVRMPVNVSAETTRVVWLGALATEETDNQRALIVTLGSSGDVHRVLKNRIQLKLVGTAIQAGADRTTIQRGQLKKSQGGVRTQGEGTPFTIKYRNGIPIVIRKELLI